MSRTMIHLSVYRQKNLMTMTNPSGNAGRTNWWKTFKRKKHLKSNRSLTLKGIMMSRPNVPAELKRRVLCEAGHRCAIPACREIIVDVHHIVPWSKCKEHNYENLIALCPNCHRLADRGHIDQKSLKIYKANLRYAHDKFSQLEFDILSTLSIPSPKRVE